MAKISSLFPGSEIARASVECELGISYGLGEREKFDIYGTQTLPGGNAFWCQHYDLKYCRRKSLSTTERILYFFGYKIKFFPSKTIPEI